MESSKGKHAFFIKGSMKILDGEEEFDTFALRQGWVTVTPLGWSTDIHKLDWVAKELHSWQIFEKQQ